MLSELFIEGVQVDVSETFSTLVSFVIDDVKDFGAKHTSVSKTIILPGTAKNNKLFGNIFDVTSSNPYNPDLPNCFTNFNAAKNARGIIFQSGVQVLKGLIRLTKIINDKGVKEYEASFVGELGGLIVTIGNNKLEDLDFSAYNLNYTIANIAASWDNAPGAGVFFPLIDYGKYSSGKHDWDYHALRPALYLKEYIDKILAAANFTYDCALFNTAAFKNIVIPHNQKQLTKLDDTVLKADSATSQHIINYTALAVNEDVAFDSFTGGLFTSDTLKKIFTYHGTPTLSGTLHVNLIGTYDLSTFECQIRVKKNNAVYYYDNIPLVGSGSISYNKTIDIPVNFITNDTFEINYFLQGTPTGPGDVYVTLATMKISSDAAVVTPIDYTELIEIKNAIPKGILQLDFFSSILKLWNLYVYDDKFIERKLIIAPYVDFYNTDPASIEDWTYKVDRSQPLEILPLSELNSRYFSFKYKPDTDYFNDQYKKRYNESYGDRIYDTEFAFANEDQSLQIIFSPTPLVSYLGEEKVYSTILKKSGTIEENIDSNIRLLQAKKVTGVSSWDILNSDSSTVLGSYTSYGYAGHLDDPDAPNFDLNFGSPKELFFTIVSGNLSNNMFNLWYSPYMAEITDKDSKLFTAHFYLTAKDIFNLDFSKFKYIDGSLFRLNRVIDYNTSSADTCKAELLKVIQTYY